MRVQIRCCSSWKRVWFCERKNRPLDFTDDEIVDVYRLLERHINPACAQFNDPSRNITIHLGATSDTEFMKIPTDGHRFVGRQIENLERRARSQR